MPQKKLTPKASPVSSKEPLAPSQAKKKRPLDKSSQLKQGQKKLKRTKPKRHEIYQELAKIAFCDPSVVLALSENAKPLELDSWPDALKSSIQTLEIKHTKQGVYWKVRFYNKLTALQILLNLVKKSRKKAELSPAALESFLIAQEPPL